MPEGATQCGREGCMCMRPLDRVDGQCGRHTPADRIGVLLDVDAKTVTVFKNRELLGSEPLPSKSRKTAAFCWAIHLNTYPAMCFAAARVDAAPMPALGSAGK